MSSLKRTLPIIRRSCRPSSCRSFHTISSVDAQKSPRKPSLSTRKIATPSPGLHRRKEIYHPEECMPPTVLLQSARKSGALEIDVEKAIEVLRGYQKLEGNTREVLWEKRLCDGKLNLLVNRNSLSYISEIIISNRTL